MWRIEPDNWHIAQDEDRTWRVFQEGAPTAESRHETREDALEAARAMLSEGEGRIKVHEPDGTLDRVIHPDRM